MKPAESTLHKTDRKLLPDFVIIGAEKAATSSLHLYLSAHPALFMPTAKEVSFFTRFFDRGPDWYHQFFRPGLTKGATLFGEATPSYLHTPGVPERMAQIIPEAKLIAVLRDPIARAYSHYWNRVRGGWEKRDFATVVKAHLNGHEGSVIVAAGRYADHLNKFAPFYPRERLCVVFTEHLSERPAEVCRGIFSYLDVASDFVPPNLTQRVNEAALPRSEMVRNMLKRPSVMKRALRRLMPAPLWLSMRLKLLRWNTKHFVYPPMEPQVKQQLGAYYRDSDQKLSEQYGPLPW